MSSYNAFNLCALADNSTTNLDDEILLGFFNLEPNVLPHIALDCNIEAPTTSIDGTHFNDIFSNAPSSTPYDIDIAIIKLASRFIDFETVDKALSCHICNKFFLRTKDLNKHFRIHTGIKKCACKICGLLFSDPTVRCRHERTHAGLTPYTCVECNHKFTRSSSLQRHLRVQHNRDLYTNTNTKMNTVCPTSFYIR